MRCLCAPAVHTHAAATSRTPHKKTYQSLCDLLLHQDLIFSCIVAPYGLHSLQQIKQVLAVSVQQLIG